MAQILTIIGEAATRLDSQLTRFHSTVPWPDIVGLRNILVREYFGIYWPLVWQTVRDDTPVLRKQIAGILGQDFSE